MLFNSPKLVITTLPKKNCKSFISELLNQRLIACVNLIDNVESMYWWKNKIATDTETMVIIKTTKKKIKEIKNFFLVNHPYETPELIVLDIHAEQKYLEWMIKETGINE
ncbi:MAG: divalent-cation tolerance protein CutA [Methylophilaceae bacterium]